MKDTRIRLEEFPPNEFLDEFDGRFHVRFEVVCDVVVCELADFGGGGDAGVVDEDI